MTQPFTVLHVCLGNICRSPMAERLFELRMNEIAGSNGIVRSMSAGTGDWHTGEDMNPPAAHQLRLRGASADGFQASLLDRELIDAAELILVAGAQHRATALQLAPHATNRVFLLRQFGRLIQLLREDHAAMAQLPVFGTDAATVRERGKALVAMAAGLNDSHNHEDELADPWGLDEATFRKVADQIDASVTSLALTLAGK